MAFGVTAAGVVLTADDVAVPSGATADGGVTVGGGRTATDACSGVVEAERLGDDCCYGHKQNSTNRNKRTRFSSSFFSCLRFGDTCSALRSNWRARVETLSN
jgi:hypothetical protein